MKKIWLGVLAIVLLSFGGCFGNEGNEQEKELTNQQVMARNFKQLLSDYKTKKEEFSIEKSQKREIISAIKDGVYVDNAEKLNYYTFDYLIALNESGIDGICAVMYSSSASGERAYIVLSNKGLDYAEMANYEGPTDFTEGPAILMSEKILVTEIVMDIAEGEEKIASGERIVATLSDLILTEGTITFDSTMTTYDISVGNDVTALTVSAITTDITGASIAINDEMLETKAITLNVGLNTITLKVTAEDGTTTKIYTLNVTREANNDTTLSDLKVNGTIIEGFVGNKTDYTIVLAYGTTTVPTVTAITNNSTANADIVEAITVLGTTVITVTAEDGTTEDYRVNIELAKNNDATLSDLILTEGTITFDSTTITYDVTVGNNVTALTVSAITTDITGASITINDEILDTKAIVLNVGLNTITLKVIAEDGTTEKVYTLKVTREANSDSTLSDLKVDGTTIGEFAGNITDYTIVLPYGTTVVPTVVATKNNVTANVNLVDATTVSGTTVITVTAEDGTIATYTITFSIEEFSLEVVIVKGTLIQDIFQPYTVTITTNDSAINTVEIYAGEVATNKVGEITVVSKTGSTKIIVSKDTTKITLKANGHLEVIKILSE